MINEIELFANSLIIQKSNLTVIVGANHSGKTLFLKELMELISGSKDFSKLRIIKNVKQEDYDAENIKKLLEDLGYPLINEEQDDGSTILIDNNRVFLRKDATIGSQISKYLIKYLDIQSRFILLQQVHNISLRDSPQNPLQTILRNKELRQKIRKKIQEATGLILTTDVTTPHTISIKIAKTEPSDSQETTFLNDAIKFHDNTKSIANYSDGIKSYVGIILSLFGDRHKIILLDEPDAFLHPPLQYQLGKDISNHAVELDKQIYIATHSANLLMGCLEASYEINIIRLGYDEINDSGSATILSKEFLVNLMKNPLIRHTNFINALFYKYVIICEADKDRVFYSEVNKRLNEQGYGIKDCLFINSPNGKDALKYFCEGLVKFSMPFVVIVDFDIINEGLTNILKSSGLQNEQIQAINHISAPIKNYCKKNQITIKSGGINKINDDQIKKLAEDLIDKLKRYSIFIVPCGDLEYWLEEFKVNPNHKDTWLNDIFDKIGLAPQEKNYKYPDINKDVWKFMEDIANWLKSRPY